MHAYALAGRLTQALGLSRIPWIAGCAVVGLVGLGPWQKEELEAVGEPGLELAGCPAVVGGQQQV